MGHCGQSKTSKRYLKEQKYQNQNIDAITEINQQFPKPITIIENQINQINKNEEQVVVAVSNQIEIQLDDICKLCSKQIIREKSIKVELCGHYFDINCFISHFTEKRTCCREEKIKINQKAFPKQLVDEIMKNHLKKIKSGQKTKFVNCSNSFCPFFFIYKKELNPGQSKIFYCDKCSSLKHYDQHMCNVIDKQTALQYENCSNQEETENQETTFNHRCALIEHKDAQIDLPCKHVNCIECLFQQFNKTLKAVCKCGKNFPTNLFKKYKSNELLEIYQKQLQVIMEETNLSWQFCRQNCGFFYCNQNLNDNFSYCLNCDDGNKTCFKCQQELFSEYITLPECNHNYHLICSIDILMDNNLKNLSCKCGKKLDVKTKKQLNITCLKCNNYDDDLIILECFHFIHKKCWNNNQSQCFICNVPFSQENMNRLSQVNNNHIKLN